MKNSKGKNSAAGKETVGRVLAGNRDANEISNDKNGKVFHAKNEKQSAAIGNGLDRVQKRTVTHVAFSTYLSHELNHLSIGHVIKMDQTFINDGNGYNQNTGIFTVPASGVYLLTYSIENTHKTHHLEVELLVDNKHMGTLLAYNYGQMASKTIKTRLAAGQSVWLEMPLTLIPLSVPPVGTNSQLSLEYVCTNLFKNKFSLVLRKPVFGVSDQVRQKPGYTVTEDS